MSLTSEDIRIGQIWGYKEDRYIVSNIRKIDAKGHLLAELNDYSDVYVLTDIESSDLTYDKYLAAFCSMQLISDVQSSKENTNG